MNSRSPSVCRALSNEPFAARSEQLGHSSITLELSTHQGDAEHVDAAAKVAALVINP